MAVPAETNCCSIVLIAPQAANNSEASNNAFCCEWLIFFLRGEPRALSNKTTSFPVARAATSFWLWHVQCENIAFGY